MKPRSANERALRFAVKLQRQAAEEAVVARYYRDVEGWHEAAVLYQLRSGHSYILAERHRAKAVDWAQAADPRRRARNTGSRSSG